MNRLIDNAHILIVDDDAILRMMAGQALRRAGFRVSEATDGPEGVQVASEGDCDLVLLDVMMPGLDGFEVCQKLRQSHRGRDLTIVMLTGLDDSESIEKAYRVGASDFIPKPINWTLLVHRVRYNLRAALTRNRLAASQASLSRAQSLARMGNWEWWPERQIFNCSDEFARLFDLGDVERCVATPLTLVDRALEADRPLLRAARQGALDHGKPYQLRFRSCAADGAVRVFREEAHVTCDSEGRVTTLEAISQDISQMVASEERVRYLSYHDQTTGLPTRQFFLEVATHALEQARRERRQCAMLYVDIDHFRQINARFGNDPGDHILRTIAQRITDGVRAADISGIATTPEGIEVAARAGGDEFLVMLSHLRRETDVSLVADRILRAIREPFRLNEDEIIITASIGLSLFPRDGDDIETLVDHAEHAVTNAQVLGRNKGAFYNKELAAAAGHQLQQEIELRRAIDDGELVLHYQPKFDLGSGRIIGVEALVRWQHPERGLLSPADFIPLAEERGLVVSLGHRVFDLACQQIARQRRLHPEWPPLATAINLSALSFLEDNLVERLTRRAEYYGIPAGTITLEVTETSLMQCIHTAVSRLESLRQAGFHLALDDFGTGYSSLGYLKTFPVDQIKIDRSFVHDITWDAQDVAIVGAVIALARKFGLEIVAEGVENGDQAQVLLGMGCPVAQGYHFARPMPAADLERLLAGEQPG